MRRAPAWGLCLALAIAGATFYPSAAKADGEDGKAVFLKYDCQSCHEVEAQQIQLAGKLEEEDGTPPDLSAVGDEVTDAAWLEKWLKKRVKKDGTKHKKRFRGNKKELAVLIDWLLSLKSK